MTDQIILPVDIRVVKRARATFQGERARPHCLALAILWYFKSDKNTRLLA